MLMIDNLSICIHPNIIWCSTTTFTDSIGYHPHTYCAIHLRSSNHRYFEQAQLRFCCCCSPAQLIRVPQNLTNVPYILYEDHHFLLLLWCTAQYYILSQIHPSTEHRFRLGFWKEFQKRRCYLVVKLTHWCWVYYIIHCYRWLRVLVIVGNTV